MILINPVTAIIIVCTQYDEPIMIIIITAQITSTYNVLHSSVVEYLQTWIKTCKLDCS